MILTINDIDLTAYLVSYSLTRTNDLSGGLSTLTCELVIIQPDTLELRRCHDVTLDLSDGGVAENQQALVIRLEVIGWTQQSDGTTTISLTQLDGKHFARQPVYSKKQLTNPNTGIRRSSLIADVLGDFSVPHSVTTFGDLQYGLAGSYDSDPISVAVGLAVASGYLTYVTTNNSQVRFMSYYTMISKQAVATSNHVLERAGITPPALDKVVVVGTSKQQDTTGYKKQTIYESSKSVFGTIEEETTTTVDAETGDESSQTNCMMKLVRPDTDPTNALMIIKERSSKKTYSDNQGRITGYVTEVDRNTAAIAPDTTDSSILIPAERVEYSADFDKTTSELKSTVETTYQVHVIGRVQLVHFKPSGIEQKQVSKFTIKAPTATETPLTEEEENNQYISPRVLTKKVTTKYTRVGRNTWRESVTVSERQFKSKTRGTNGAKNESQEVRLLGGMMVTQNSSRNVDSVPLAQTLPTNEPEIINTEHVLTFTGQTIPSVCTTKRVERIELAGAVSQTYLMQAGKLQALPRLNQSHALSLIATPDSLKLLTVPYSKLATNEYNLLPTNLSYVWTAGSGYEYAGTFLVLSNATRTYPTVTVPPPIVVRITTPGQEEAGVIQIPTTVDAAPVAGVQQAIAKPLRPITTGTAVATIDVASLTEDETHWYVSDLTVAPTINTTTASYPWTSLGVSPIATTSLEEISLDTLPTTDYTTVDVEAYSYLEQPSISEVVAYQSQYTAYVYG